MMLDRKIVKKKGNIGDQTRKNQSRNSQVGKFEDQQRDENSKAETQIMNKLQRILIPEAYKKKE
jgi:hypothetical protein